MAILYITQQGAMLHKSGNQVIVKKGREVLQEIPIVHLDEVVIFGNGHITTPTMGYLLGKNIPVSFLSSRGKYKGKTPTALCQRYAHPKAAIRSRCRAVPVPRISEMLCPRQNNKRYPVFATPTHPKCRRGIGTAHCTSDFRKT